MKKGVPIEGRVVDADGKPVAGARVLSTDNQRAMFTEHRSVCRLDGRRRAVPHRAGQAGGVVPRGQRQGPRPGRSSRDGRHGGPASRDHPGPAAPVYRAAWSIPTASRSPGHSSILTSGAATGAWGHFSGPTPTAGSAGTTRPTTNCIVNVNQQGYRGVFPAACGPVRRGRRLHAQALLEDSRARCATPKPGSASRTPRSNMARSTRRRASHRSWTRMPEVGFSTGVFQGNLDINFPVTADAYKFRVRSPGFQPFVSRTFQREEKVVDRLRHSRSCRARPSPPEPSRPCSGPTASRSPAAGCSKSNTAAVVSIQDGVANVSQGRKGREDRTGPDGTFPIPQYDEAMVRLHPGRRLLCVRRPRTSLEKSPKIQAKPYARIEGQYRIGSRPVPNQELELHGMIGHPDGCLQHLLNQKATTDPEGRFIFEKVIPALRCAHRSHETRTQRRGVWSLGEAGPRRAWQDGRGACSEARGGR